MPAEVILRPATVQDLPVLADVHLASRLGAGDAFPPGVHSDADVRAWVGSWDLTTYDVWLARLADRVVGYARCTPTWLDDLYVLPDVQGHGVGSTLLDLVKAERPDGFGLWVFESNVAAREFYARHGFVALERTDGSANEERSPDLKLVWPGHDPLACFRSMIDDVDLVLGDVLARRAALTRAVQDHKRATSATADPGRDASREAEIVARIAAVAPELGEERVARIVHAIITESLDASRH
jgi:GNAT superfamily N-acetyltransferase/chorismate mutase